MILLFVFHKTDTVTNYSIRNYTHGVVNPTCLFHCLIEFVMVMAAYLNDIPAV